MLSTKYINGTVLLSAKQSFYLYMIRIITGVALPGAGMTTVQSSVTGIRAPKLLNAHVARLISLVAAGQLGEHQRGALVF